MTNQTVDERILNLDKMLDEYNLRIGLTCFKNDIAVQSILNYTNTDIRSLSEEECGEDGFALLRYAGYVQKECNRFNARIRWLQRCINLETASNMKSYGDKFTSYNERIFAAQNDPTNEYMKKLQDLLMHCEVRKEELSFLSSKVSAMAQALIEQKQSKRKSKWE